MLAQALDAFGHFAAGVGGIAVEPVQPGTGVGIDHGDGHGLGGQVAQHRNQRGVLEHVSVVAGVEGVTVTEHLPMIGHARPRI